MLDEVEHAFAQLYDLQLDVRARDFLCDAEMANRLSPGAAHRGEAVLVQQDHDSEDVGLGLYVDANALQLANGPGAWRDRERFGACLLLAEGVSHFLYLAYRAQHQQHASLFELELQGEIDKYVAALIATRPRAPVHYSRALRHRLFRRMRFLDGPRSEAGRRYRRAHHLAERYTGRLERHLVRRDYGAMRAELRRFYRLGAQGKVAQASGK